MISIYLNRIFQHENDLLNDIENLNYENKEIIKKLLVTSKYNKGSKNNTCSIYGVCQVDQIFHILYFNENNKMKYEVLNIGLLLNLDSELEKYGKLELK